MEDIIRGILARELQDFKGTEIKGRLVVADELVNRVLTEIVNPAKPSTPPEAAAGPSAAADQPPVDLQQLLAYLKIKQLRYHTEKGRAVLDLDVGV